MNKDERKYLYDLIGEGEHRQLDFKFEISDARKIARTFSAFSNTEGGRLLIGVKDNGKIRGIRSDEEFYMAESAAHLHCKPEVKFKTKSFLVEGKTVLEVYIPPVAEKPVYARDENNRWMAYVRVEDQNVLAEIVQLRLWEEEHEEHGVLLEFTKKEHFLLEYLEKSGSVSLSKIQADTGFKRQELISLLTRLVRFDVAKMMYRGTQVHYQLK